MNEVMNFEIILNEIRRNNLALRRSLKEERGGISPIFWLVNMCTIRLDMGRCSGKTWYITNYATKNDLVVFSNNSELTRFKRMNDKPMMITELTKLHGLSEKPTVIYIENPSLCFQTFTLHRLAEMVVDSEKEQMIIILGA